MLAARLDAAPLLAWGLLRHDAGQRSPAERAILLDDLGIRNIALDWRYDDLGRLDTEWSALRARKIGMTALWAPVSLTPANDTHLDLLFDFIERRGLQLALWSTLIYPPDFYDWVDSKKLALTCEAMTRLAERAGKLGCTVSLYNFDGWFGQPNVLAKIAERSGRSNMGIVYNFHHAQGDTTDFAQHVAAMRPFLAAVTISGVHREKGPPLPFGQGDLEFAMLKALLDGGYRGPLALACHDARIDAAATLKQGLEGMGRFKTSLLRTAG